MRRCRAKRASILIAAAVPMLIACLLAVILQTANASIILSKTTKENVAELYDMEALHTLLLDSVVADMMDTQVLVTMTKEGIDFEATDAEMQLLFPEGEVLYAPATLEHVAEDLGLSKKTQDKLAYAIGKNTNEKISVVLSGSPHISADTAVIEDEEGIIDLLIDDFELSVDMETRRAMVSKIWHIEEVYLEVNSENKLASLDFSRAMFTPTEAEFK